MQHLPPVLTLPAQKARMINASEGCRLEVRSGCLWLTRPNDLVDRFLVAGTSIDLHESGVLIQSDTHPGATGLPSTHYVLVPMNQVAAHPHAITSIVGIFRAIVSVSQAWTRLTRPLAMHRFSVPALRR